MKPWTTLWLPSDFSTTSSSAVDVPGLSFTPLAGAYEFIAMLMLRTATTTVNPRIGVGWPTAGVTDGVATIMVAQGTGAQLFSHGNPSAPLLSAVGGFPTTTGSWPATLRGLIMGGVTTGAVRLQLASETAGTAVTIRGGSYFRYRRAMFM